MRLIDADELKTAFPCGEIIRTESVRATIDHMSTIKTFTLADIEEQYRKGMEKGLEEAETKKCPIFSDDEVKQPCVKSPCGFERQHGEWLWNTTFNNIPYCKCSVCGIGMGNTEWDFCPNCGADMRKKRGETGWKSEE